MRMRSTLLWAWLFVGVQPVWAEAQALHSEPSSVEQRPSAGRFQLLDLTPAATERFFRALQLSYGIADVADFRIVRDVFERNPDDALRKATIMLRGAALFRTPADFRLAFTTVADNAKTFDELSNVHDPFPTESGDKILTYLAQGRKRDRVARFVGAFTASGSWSDRAQLDTFGLTLPPDANDTTRFSFDATFDSAALFRTAADRKAAYEAFTAYLRIFPKRAEGLRVAAPCDASARDCIARLAGLSRRWAIWASLIPTIKLESIDEFDYATLGGQPILFPKAMRDGVLTTYTYTWDLQRIFKGTELRTEAVNAYKAFKALTDTIHKSSANLMIAPVELKRDQFQVVRLRATYRGPDGPVVAEGVLWKRPKEGAWIDGLFLTGEGELVGVPRCAGACDRIDLVLTFGREREPIPVQVTLAASLEANQ